MKDEILKIIEAQPEMEVQEGMLLDVGQEAMAEQLQVLMCYREVRAYSMGHNEFHDELSFEQFIQGAFGVFVKDYPEDVVLEVINKVKSEYA